MKPGSMKYMLITNDPLFTRVATQAGVSRIFIDLERLGKSERQAGRDTLISRHELSDIEEVKAAMQSGELLVRINPVHERTGHEIEQSVQNGADIIMLPMFRTMDEINRVVEFIAGRARFMPLIETPEAMDILQDIANHAGVDELYIGLNDLHIAYGMKFMFEPLANGQMDKVAQICRQAGKPFGFGGIARVDEGSLPGRKVLAEHLRLGSSAVILSRTFMQGLDDGSVASGGLQFRAELQLLHALEEELITRTDEGMESDRMSVVRTVMEITEC